MQLISVITVFISICGLKPTFVTSNTSIDLLNKPRVINSIDQTTDQTPQTKVECERFKVVCYFTNWSFYRQGNGTFLPENIDARLCTHIIYSFAELASDTLTLQVSDRWVDIDNKLYERVTAFRQKGVKVLISMGGRNDSQGDKYGRLLLNETARQHFITNAISFLHTYNFDGLDLDLEYPACWQGHCQSSRSEEKKGFAKLVKELSYAFKPLGLLLSAAVSANQRIIDFAYDVPNLAKHLDWISMMTYDYHGSWDNQTGHHAPLHSSNPTDDFCVDCTTQYWIQSGAPSVKLVLGFPTYGRTFTLANPKNNGLHAPTIGPGEAAPFTRASGMISLYEICEKNVKDWTIVPDLHGWSGPYAFKDSQWISLEDKDIVLRKAQFIRDMNLGGGMIWALDLDDFLGVCSDGKYAILTTINSILRDH